MFVFPLRVDSRNHRNVPIWGSQRRGLEELCLQGYDAAYSIENQLTPRRSRSPPSSGSKNKQETSRPCCLLRAGFLLGLFLDPEDEGDMFLRNVVYFQRTTWCYIPKKTILHFRLMSVFAKSRFSFRLLFCTCGKNHRNLQAMIHTGLSTDTCAQIYG
jgi:hypothetical protein